MSLIIGDAARVSGAEGLARVFVLVTRSNGSEPALLPHTEAFRLRVRIAFFF